jgi:hypothetical protein
VNLVAVDVEHEAMVGAAPIYRCRIVADDVAARADPVDLGEHGAGKIDGDVLAPAPQETVGRRVRGGVPPDDVQFQSKVIGPFSRGPAAA